MFGLAWFSRSSKNATPPPVSLIGEDTTIRGDVISGTGDLRVEGTIRADIERNGRVLVAPGGTIHGSVRAWSIQVAGTVRGALRAEETLILASASDVRARLQAPALTIEPGADFRGKVYDETNTPEAPPVGDHLPAAEPPRAVLDGENASAPAEPAAA
jgi:cytoskeletal protein CcmA (bactofilin family)